jgi:hypothetical protein
LSISRRTLAPDPKFFLASKKFLALEAPADILPDNPVFSGQACFRVEGKVMTSSGVVDLDFIEELRLRRWARENYVPPSRRQGTWHPIVHEEMEKKDLESVHPNTTAIYASSAR